MDGLKVTLLRGPSPADPALRDDQPSPGNGVGYGALALADAFCIPGIAFVLVKAGRAFVRREPS